MSESNKENTTPMNYRINRSPLTSEEAADIELFKEFGITDTSNPYQSVSIQHINGIKYYIKTHTTGEPVRIWNDLYGEKRGKLLKYKDAVYRDSLSYFPELGTSVIEQEKHVCSHVTKLAQYYLNKIGYFHTDLYNSDEYGNITHYNCNNVRMYGDRYYPIDTEKIVKLSNGGNKKRKTNKKSNKAKKTNNKKAKKTNNKKAKKTNNKKAKK
jgi:hypothetical protein